MKKLIYLLLCLYFISCSSENKINVSEVPINTNIMGIELLSKMQYYQMYDKLECYTDTSFYTQQGKVDNFKVYQFIPYNKWYMPCGFVYGTLTWNYIEVVINSNSQIVAICMIKTLEKEETVKHHFTTMTNIISEKYGTPNTIDEKSLYWTDKINYIDLEYNVDVTLSGTEKYFCVIRYKNNLIFNTNIEI